MKKEQQLTRPFDPRHNLAVSDKLFGTDAGSVQVEEPTRTVKNFYRPNKFTTSLNIYEVHLFSWSNNHAHKVDYEELKQLVRYVKEQGFNTIELMPLQAHPLDESWGYQISSFKALTSRLEGGADTLIRFINYAHKKNLRVILDFVVGHFLRNEEAVSADEFGYPEGNSQRDNHAWGAYNTDLTNKHVQDYIIDTAKYWLTTYGFDGMRLDAVSNTIYWNYLKDNQSVNYEAVNFWKRFNSEIHDLDENIITIAEEATSKYTLGQPITGSPVESLGFDFKWDLGFMNDTLKFFSIDPLYRREHTDLLTFSFVYKDEENFILPFSHDEVVHGKGSMLTKMWSDDRDLQLQQLKSLYLYQAMHPGKTLDFMHNELAPFVEFAIKQQKHRPTDFDEFWTYGKKNGAWDFSEYRQKINDLFANNNVQFDSIHSEHFTTEFIDDGKESGHIVFKRQADDDMPLWFIMNIDNADNNYVRITSEGKIKNHKLKPLEAIVIDSYGKRWI